MVVICAWAGLNRSVSVPATLSSVVLPELPAVALPPEAWSDWLWTAAGTALDRAVVEAMTRVIDATMMPPAEDLPALRSAAAPFMSGPLWDAPRRFFARRMIYGPSALP